MGLDKKWHKQLNPVIGIANARRMVKTIKQVGGNPMMKTKITKT